MKITGLLALWFTLTLSWNDNSNNEDGFKIERRYGAGGWKEFSRVGRDTTTTRITVENAPGKNCFRIVTFAAPDLEAEPSKHRCIDIDRED